MSHENFLSAVIISRNEEDYIERSIESVISATAGIPNCTIVLVDSRSEDRTVERAQRFPIDIVRLSATEPRSAALGRLVGEHLTNSRYILFADGDTVINPDWVEAGLRELERQRDVAGVGGKLHEVYYRRGVRVAENPDFFQMGNTIEEAYQLGGNALYRREALTAVGSFNPYVVSHEEAELAERLRKARYRLIRIPVLVGSHHTPLRGTFEEVYRRVRSNLMTGYGQVLRLSMRQGLFWVHARHVSRYLLFIAFLLLGILLALASLLAWSPRYIAVWALLGISCTLLFAVRRRSLAIPLGFIMDWAVSAPAILWGFVQAPRRREGFSVDRAIESVNGRPYGTATGARLRQRAVGRA